MNVCWMLRMFNCVLDFEIVMNEHFLNAIALIWICSTPPIWLSPAWPVSGSYNMQMHIEFLDWFIRYAFLPPNHEWTHLWLTHDFHLRIYTHTNTKAHFTFHFVCTKKFVEIPMLLSIYELLIERIGEVIVLIVYCEWVSEKEEVRKRDVNCLDSIRIFNWIDSLTFETETPNQIYDFDWTIKINAHTRTNQVAIVNLMEFDISGYDSYWFCNWISSFVCIFFFIDFTNIHIWCVTRFSNYGISMSR